MLEPWAWRHKGWKKWPYFHLVEKRLLRQGRRACSPPPSRRPERLRELAAAAARRNPPPRRHQRARARLRERARRARLAPRRAGAALSLAHPPQEGPRSAAGSARARRRSPGRRAWSSSAKASRPTSARLPAWVARHAEHAPAHRMDRRRLGRSALALLPRRGPLLSAHALRKFRPRGARSLPGRHARPHHPRDSLGRRARRAAATFAIRKSRASPPRSGASGASRSFDEPAARARSPARSASVLPGRASRRAISEALPRRFDLAAVCLYISVAHDRSAPSRKIPPCSTSGTASSAGAAAARSTPSCSR